MKSMKHSQSLRCMNGAVLEDVLQKALVANARSSGEELNLKKRGVLMKRYFYAS